MKNFRVGEHVYIKEHFIDGKIVDIKEDVAYIEFNTPEGGGCLLIRLSELEHKEDEPGEHPVWQVLNKETYVEEFVPQAEKMYDFIKSMVNICGNTTIGGNTVPIMQVFFDMWNNYSKETFRILDSLVNSGRQ